MEFLTVQHATAYGVSLQAARGLTEEEKRHYLPEFWESAFVGIGETISLDYVCPKDMSDRPHDGEFAGCYNRAWKISQEEWDKYVKLNESRKAEKEESARAARIKYLESQKEQAERQVKVSGGFPSEKEVKKRIQEWNTVQNEGGEGYTPHIYSAEEYKRICDTLEALKK